MEHKDPHIEEPEGEREEEQEEEEDAEDVEEGWKRPRDLPPDLPRSLDDRRTYTGFGEETEYYDAWQGKSSLAYSLGKSVLTLFQDSHNS